MKIDAVFCDLHPDKHLTEVPIELSTRRTFEDERALRCTQPGCTRYYHYDFGYFAFIPGEEPDLGNLAAKPSCKLKHDLLYMVLTRIDGQPVYACFFPECPITIPFKPK